MKIIRNALIIALAVAACGVRAGRGQTNNGIDPEAIIEQILEVERDQREQISDVVFDAEYVEGEEKDGEFQEKVRFVKKVFVKYLEDTALYHEEYLEYYKDGELKSENDLDKEARDRIDKKRKRNARDVSYSMLEPFQPENRDGYDIQYIGVTDDRVEGYFCHHFRVTSKEEVEGNVNGDFFFEAASFNLVRVDFSPAKLVKKTFFRLKDMSMSITYAPTGEGYWLPYQFDISGKGKAMFFIGVKFAGSEYYRNPVINGGIDDQIWEEADGR